MIVVSNRIPVAKGQEDAFAKRFRGRAGLVEGHNGFVRLHILKSTDHRQKCLLGITCSNYMK